MSCMKIILCISLAIGVIFSELAACKAQDYATGKSVHAKAFQAIGWPFESASSRPRKSSTIIVPSECGSPEKTTDTNSTFVSPVAVLDTDKGIVKIKLFKKEAPLTTANFISLCQSGFYNGLIFHRYEPGFVIQGGDPTGTGAGGYIDPKTHKERCIPLEVNPKLKHSALGVVAMARAADPNSASCQFYITLAPTPHLDGQYAIFGEVVQGMVVIQNLRAKDKINSAKIIEEAKANISHATIMAK